MFAAVIHSVYFHGALVGLCGAIGPDIHAFLAWKNVDEARTFNWRVALLHYAQGALGGLVATPIIGTLFGFGG